MGLHKRDLLQRATRRRTAMARQTRLRPTGYAAVACRHFIGPKPLAKADPPRAATRGILAKASERGLTFFEQCRYCVISLAPFCETRHA